MDPLKILEKHYDKDSKLYEVLLLHSKLVSQKSLQIAKNIPGLNPDTEFIYEAAMLHDIGIKYTDMPGLHCFGQHKYIEHGYLGRELLEKEGYPKHALVCERHIGVGITKQEIIEKKLPLPEREMAPKTIEEEIISFADLFYTKFPGKEKQEKTLDEVKKDVAEHGEKKLEILERWIRKFRVSS